MKKTAFTRAMALFLCVLMLSAFPTATIAAGEMAYNIYSDPDISGTSGLFDTFMIDFNGVQAAEKTYWALANFRLWFSPQTKQKYRGITGGGAYAGLQDIGNVGDAEKNRVAIMAFWEMDYFDKETKEKINLRAKRMFPDGDNHFGNEGEGTNCIRKYDWKENQWYRMILHSWTDKETGTTFVGQWVVDLQTGECTLISYFDTHLYSSCMQGNMSLFQENFYGITKELEREFRVKNIYALDHKDHRWKSFDTCKLSYGGGGANNKVGGHSFGATEEYFWGKAGGVVENQEEYDRNSQQSGNFTINQPKLPTIGKQTFEKNPLTLKKFANKWQVLFDFSGNSNPQLQYKLEILDEEGKTLYAEEATRPEVNKIKLTGKVDTDRFMARLTLTDIFGQAVTYEEKTEAYGAPVDPPTPTPEETKKPIEPQSPETPSENGESEKNENNAVVTAIVAVALVLIVGGAVAGRIHVKKKKKRK